MDPDAPTTPREGAPSEPETPRFFCERCWAGLAVQQANAPRCAKCHGDAPPGGFRALPIRFKNRFLFLAQLGRGGQGAVFRAQDLEELDAHGVPAERAIKVMRLDVPESEREDCLDRFGREASASKKFTYELRDKAKRRFFVASVADDLGRLPYIALELVTWPTLTQLLRDETNRPPAVKPLSPVETVHLGLALLAGVAVMHDKRVVHRDLKPDNLFVSVSDGRFEVKIADFGIWTEPMGVGLGEGSTRGVIRGTLRYMSPEQQCAQPVDTRSDLHAVASILWYAATGKVPYPWEQGQDKSPEAEPRAFTMRLTALQKVPPRPVEMPDGLYGVLSRALAYASGDRYPHATDFAQALEALEKRWAEEYHDAIESMRRDLAALQAMLRNRRSLVTPAVDVFNDLNLLARNAIEVERSTAAATTAEIERHRAHIQELLAEGERLDAAVAALFPPPPEPTPPPPPPPPPLRTDVVPRAAFFAALGAVGVLIALAVVLVLRPPQQVQVLVPASSSTERTPPTLLPPERVPVPQAGYARGDLQALLRGLNDFVRIGGMSPFEPSFSLQRHEVTRGEYALWLDSPEGRAHPIPWRTDARDGQSAVATLDASALSLPVVRVDHGEAAAYCAALGAALHVMEHWLLVFRQGLWGDPTRFTPGVGPRPVRDLGVDVIPGGVMGLLGNVMEWLRAPEGAATANYIGGSYTLGGADLIQNAGTATAAATTERVDELGFRCEGTLVPLDRPRRTARSVSRPP